MPATNKSICLQLTGKKNLTGNQQSRCSDAHTHTHTHIRVRIKSQLNALMNIIIISYHKCVTIHIVHVLHSTLKQIVAEQFGTWGFGSAAWTALHRQIHKWCSCCLTGNYSEVTWNRSTHEEKLHLCILVPLWIKILNWAIPIFILLCTSE